MGQMKEADFIRWGNTKRMTGLRKAEQDGLWEGIKERTFISYQQISGVSETMSVRPQIILTNTGVSHRK